MIYGMRFMTLYRRQGSRPSPWKRNAKKKNGCLGRPYKQNPNSSQITKFQFCWSLVPLLLCLHFVSCLRSLFPCLETYRLGRVYWALFSLPVARPHSPRWWGRGKKKKKKLTGFFLCYRLNALQFHLSYLILLELIFMYREIQGFNLFPLIDNPESQHHFLRCLSFVHRFAAPGFP